MDAVLTLVADLLGCRRCRKPDGAPGWEWLPKRAFNDCLGCGAIYHESWDAPGYTYPDVSEHGGLCPNCSGAD